MSPFFRLDKSKTSVSGDSAVSFIFTLLMSYIVSTSGVTTSATAGTGISRLTVEDG